MSLADSRRRALLMGQTPAGLRPVYITLTAQTTAPQLQTLARNAIGNTSFFLHAVTDSIPAGEFTFIVSGVYIRCTVGGVVSTLSAIYRRKSDGTTWGEANWSTASITAPAGTTFAVYGLDGIVNG